MRIGFGLKLAPQRTSIEQLRAVWEIADRSQADHLWNFDHFAPMNAEPQSDLFEAWTLLGAMAEATSRVRIGCLVTGNVFRHPAMLAKMATTVDHLSSGRLLLGIGAGRAEAEHEMLGLSYPPNRDRIDALEEACVVIKALWSEPVANFEGQHYRLRAAVANPKPIHQPHPPIWIGGMGERSTLAVVARHADVWNLAADDLELGAHLSRVLDERCASVGRDPAEVARSVQFPVPDGLTSALDKVGRYLDAGFSEFVFTLGANPKEAALRAAELIEALGRELVEP